jgi:hypothetical protein
MQECPFAPVREPEDNSTKRTRLMKTWTPRPRNTPGAAVRWLVAFSTVSLAARRQRLRRVDERQRGLDRLGRLDIVERRRDALGRRCVFGRLQRFRRVDGHGRCQGLGRVDRLRRVDRVGRCPGERLGR